jgi:hypothetical protein
LDRLWIEPSGGHQANGRTQQIASCDFDRICHDNPLGCERNRRFADVSILANLAFGA